MGGEAHEAESVADAGRAESPRHTEPEGADDWRERGGDETEMKNIH
jgi:hypothetical protein